MLRPDVLFTKIFSIKNIKHKTILLRYQALDSFICALNIQHVLLILNLFTFFLYVEDLLTINKKATCFVSR